MELTKRLQAVADMVTAGNRVADIGCDHGYVSIYLSEQHISPRIIAMDVNAGPLKKAKEHIKQHGLLPYIETRLSDGTARLLPEEVETLLCAGMGGKLMIRIMEEGKTVIPHLKEIILQPQSEIHLVRQYMRKIGFAIVAEKMVYEEGKYYPMMRAVPDSRLNYCNKIVEDSLLTIYDKYGRLLLESRDPVLRSFLQKRSQDVARLVTFLSQEAYRTDRQKQRIIELRKELEEILLAQSFYKEM